MEEDKQPVKVPAPEIEADLPLPAATSPVPSPQSQAAVMDPEIKNNKVETTHQNPWHRFRSWCKSHKKLSIPAGVLAVVFLLLLIPGTRYPIAGAILKKNFTVLVTDQTTLAPVSGATVRSGNVSVLSDGNGKANLRLAVGRHNLSITKKYYQDRQADVLVPILSQKTVPAIAAQATGRQVKVVINNSISKKGLADVDIKVLDITAKTDKDGKALLVLPPGVATQKTTLALNGYNSSDVSVKVSDSTVAENDFTMTPAGKVYFLSKLSGKIDVVKSNLDGTSRETVLAGTGREDNLNTVLLASRDWKYLALLSRRDSDLAKLYMIETSNDKVTAVDEGNADFSLIGWSDANFIYQVNRRGYQDWQPKAQALKSYNAAANKITILDETDAQGSNDFDYNSESFGSVYVVGQRVVFVKGWYSSYYDSASLDDNLLGIYSISVTGSSGRSTHKTFGYTAGESTYIQSFPFRPNQIDFQVVEKGSEPKYFVYANGQASEKPSIKDDFDNYQNGGQYNTYLASPSGSSTFWSESRDGKSSLFVGDASGDGAKQVAALSDYQTYGWYGEDYLLTSKNGSELYILTSGGIDKDGDALKITDYHKPVVSYPGYGGSYGGL